MCGHGTWGEGREVLSLAVLGGAEWWHTGDMASGSPASHQAPEHFRSLS